MIKSNLSVLSTEADKSDWLDFVANHPQATIFHHPAWSQMLTECYGYKPIILAKGKASGEICAGLPMLQVGNKLTGRREVSLPFSDFCEPLVSENTNVAEFVSEIRAWQKHNDNLPVEINWPVLPVGARYTGQSVFRHITLLEKDPAVLLRRFRKGVKSSIRQSINAGVVVKVGTSWDDLELFYRIHARTRKRLGVPVQPLRYFRSLWKYIISHGLGFVLTAYQGERPLASAVFLHWNLVLTYKYSASDPAYWHLSPNNLLLWHAISWGCHEGYRIFDWGKTDFANEGLRTFKRGWASTEDVLHYSVLADKPPKDRWKKYMLIPLALSIRHLPEWYCRLAGNLLYGHFN